MNFFLHTTSITQNMCNIPHYYERKEKFLMLKQVEVPLLSFIIPQIC